MRKRQPPDRLQKSGPPLSASRCTGDLDGDGDEDVALFILQDSGGSGNF
jgi:hypothetical protein